MNTFQLQAWINERACREVVVVDGKPGPRTRAALIDAFRNKHAPAVTPGELRMYADRLGCTVRQMAAVASVESAGGGWDDTGLLKALYERHYLWRRVKLAVPFLSDPKPGGYTIDADKDGINDSWEKLADATLRFGADLAFECASFGKFQIMGAWWKKLGYPSVLDFVYSMTANEANHYGAFARYIEVNNLQSAMRRVSDRIEDCTPIAVGYNGPKQKGYDARIARAFARG